VPDESGSLVETAVAAWSDGAGQRRWIEVPASGHFVDRADPDASAKLALLIVQLKQSADRLSLADLTHEDTLPPRPAGFTA
jgi:hypothetical protein